MNLGLISINWILESSTHLPILVWSYVRASALLNFPHKIGPISILHWETIFLKIKTKKDHYVKKTGIKTQVFKTPGAEILLYWQRYQQIATWILGFQNGNGSRAFLPERDRRHAPAISRQVQELFYLKSHAKNHIHEITQEITITRAY